MLRAVLSVCRGVTTQTVLCACLSGWGGGLQHRPCVTCCPVCMQGGYNRTAHNTVCVANPPPTDRTAHNMIYLWGGVFATQTVVCCPVCGGWIGWGVTTQTACYVPSCLSGLVRVGGLQH